MSEFRISELMNDYNEEEFLLRDEGLSTERIKKLTLDRIGPIPVRRDKRAGRTLLIAAVIALALSAAALAVYQLGLNDTVIGPAEAGEQQAKNSGEDYNRVSLLGYQGSPEYQADAEWSAYSDAYKSAHEPQMNWTREVSEIYRAYGVIDTEMAQRLDELTEKYGLALHESAPVSRDSAEGLYELMGTRPILSGDYTSAAGFGYVDGTLHLYADMRLPDGKTITYTLVSSAKGTFSNIGAVMEARYEEWHHTTPDGTTVDLALGNHMSMILADLENMFVAIHLNAGAKYEARMTLEDFEESVARQIAAGQEPILTAQEMYDNYLGRWAEIEANNALTREDLEYIADSIDFSALDEAKGDEAAFSAAYEEELERRREQARLADEARQELGDWELTDDVPERYPELYRDGRASDRSHGIAEADNLYSDDVGGWVFLAYTRYERGLMDAYEDLSTAYACEPIDGLDCAAAGYAEDGEQRTLVWADEEKDLAFTLSSNSIAKEEMLRQARALLSAGE